jgi:hypothetical protein
LEQVVEGKGISTLFLGVDVLSVVLLTVLACLIGASEFKIKILSLNSFVLREDILALQTTALIYTQNYDFVKKILNTPTFEAQP